MPPEPLPWDRKDFFKERKHERSESVGSVARWRDSSHHRDLNRWGSTEFRRPPGHGKQGGWHMFSEEPAHGYASRSGDKMLEEDSRPSASRDGKYGRSSRDNRGPFGQRDSRGHSWEASNGSPNLSRRSSDMNNVRRSVDRSVDDSTTYSSHPHSDFVNTSEQHHLKDQHDKMGGVTELGATPRCDRDNSSIDWKPLKWNRSGSLSSRSSGFSHSSSSRSMAGTDSNEAKPDLKPKNITAIESHSGEGTACVASSMPSEDTTSRKKSRLNWGEGLAKYEKKKVDPEANKYGSVSSAGNMEPCNFTSSNLVDKSPKVTGFSDCASPATPSSVACSSSPGVDDKLLGKTANADNNLSNLNDSPAPGFQNHLQKFHLNLDKLDIDSLNNLGSSIVELVQSDDPSSEDSCLIRSNAIKTLLIWKADISKVLEMTESEIDLLENELKSLKSDSVDRYQSPEALGSQQADSSIKIYEEHEVSQKVTRPVPLKIISSDEPNIEKMPLSTNLCSIHENNKEDIDSPGSATSKFVEHLPLVKAVSSRDTGGYDNLSRDMDTVQSTTMKCLVRCTARKDPSVSACNDVNTPTDVKDTFGANTCSSYEDSYNSIIASNKESANRAHGVFAKLVPKDCKKLVNMGVSNDSSSHTFVMEKFAEKKRLEKVKEKVTALKFRALHHLWKEDMRLLSIKKCRPKSHKKNEPSSSNLKNRSSIRSRFPFPAGNHLSLVPTSELINFTSKLLSESQTQIQRNTLKMPALILDEKEKMVTKFISSNGLIEDPLATEKERVMINPWTSEEKEIFLEKFAVFGKDFRKIASFLDHKTTADCVEFYYKNHKAECFQKLKMKDVGKLGKSYAARTNLMASGNKRMRAGRFLLEGFGNVKALRGGNSIIERSNSPDTLGDERETAAAADVLAGICGSLSSEAMSSCITSSIDPVDDNKEMKFLKVTPLHEQILMPDISQNADGETCSDESCGEVDLSGWTDDEKAAFLQAVSSFGKDFTKIAQCVGTRSREHCKVFFSKTQKCLGLNLVRPIPGIAGSPPNDDANGGESDTDDACLVEAGSVVDADKSGSKTDGDLPSDALNTFHDESNPLEARNLSPELNESREITGTEVHLENVDMVSDVCAIKFESKPSSDDSGVGLGKTDKSCSVNDHPAKSMSDSLEVSKGKANKLADAVREMIIKPLECGSVAMDTTVSEGSSGDLKNEVERQRVAAPPCFDDRDVKHEADAGVVVEPKSCVLVESSTTSNLSFSRVANSCSGLSFGSENDHVSFGKPHASALSTNNSQATTNSLLLNAAAASCEKAASQDSLSSNCDIKRGRDMRCHSSGSNGDHQFPLPCNHLETVSILQGYPMQVPVKKEVDGDVNCSTSATEFPFPQKVKQTDDHFKTLWNSSDSENTSRNGNVKLFGKILTSSSSNQKSNLITKGSEENGTHHTKSSNKSCKRKITSHQNSDGNLKILKFDHADYLGLENVPVKSYGFWEGTGVIQTGLPSLPDSSFLLAKYPAAFSNYPTSSSSLEQQPLQPFGASTFTARDINGSNAMLDYQMFRSRDGPKVQPFIVDAKNSQDVFSEMHRRNSFEAISSLQQHGIGVMGMNGIGRPGILVGGSCSGVSDPVAAIKMHYSNSEKYGGQNGSILGDDESWGGKGDIGR